MKMSIEKAIKQLETYSIPCGRYKEAYVVAIETMRKYQKIEHIVNDVPYLDKDEYKIASIKEIINGNDD